MGVQEAVERRPPNTQQTGGTGFVAAGLLEGGLYLSDLQLAQRSSARQAFKLALDFHGQIVDGQ